MTGLSLLSRVAHKEPIEPTLRVLVNEINVLAEGIPGHKPLEIVPFVTTYDDTFDDIEAEPWFETCPMWQSFRFNDGDWATSARMNVLIELIEDALRRAKGGRDGQG